MKNTVFLFLSLLLLSCDDKKEGLELTLINQSINCVSNLDYAKIYYYGNKKYDSIYNKLSLNVVKYKIKNSSNKKYIIVLNSDFFGHYDEYFYDDTLSKNFNAHINKISFCLYSDKKTIGSMKRDGPPTPNYLDAYMFAKSRDYLDTMVYKDLNRKQIVNDLFCSRHINYINKNSFVIHPGETKFFTTIINLPSRSFDYDYLAWDTFVEKGTEYKAGLVLYNDAKEINRFLTNDLKQEIKENGYEIYDGIIRSNKVPVKMVSIPEK